MRPRWRWRCFFINHSTKTQNTQYHNKHSYHLSHNACFGPKTLQLLWQQWSSLNIKIFFRQARGHQSSKKVGPNWVMWHENDLNRSHKNLNKEKNTSCLKLEMLWQNLWNKQFPSNINELKQRSSGQNISETMWLGNRAYLNFAPDF